MKAIQKKQMEIIKQTALIKNESETFSRPDAQIVFYDFLIALGGEFISSDVLSLTLGHTKTRLMKRGYSEEDATEAIKVIANVLSSRRSRFTQDFMG
jgi:hypothetical protein